MAFFGAGSFTWATGVAGVLAAVAAAWRLRGHDRAVAPTGIWQDSPLSPERAALLALVLAVLTAIPLPAFLAWAMGSWRMAQNDAVAATVQTASDSGLLPPMPCWFTFSRNGIGSQRAILRLTVMMLFGTLAAAHDGRGRVRLALLLVGLGTVVAALGCVAMWWIPQDNRLWWIFEVRRTFPGPVAGFINRNYFGGFAALLAPVALLAAVYTPRTRWWRTPTALAAFAILSLACLASRSRGAVASYGAGLATCVVVLAVFRRPRTAVTLAVAIAVGALFVMQHAAPDFRTRMATLASPTETLSGQLRLSAWRDALRIWRHHPYVGVGLNAFPMLYPLYRTNSASGYMSHAENEYVQTLVETGLVGAALTLAFVYMLVVAVWCRRAATPDETWLKGACLAATAVVVVHAAVDSALHIPLYAATYGIVVGLALPLAARSAKPRRAPPSIVLAAGLVSLVFGLLCIPWHWNDSLRFCRTAEAAPLARALMTAPTSWTHWLYLSKRVYTRDNPAARRVAADSLTRAGSYDPRNYRLWRTIGKFRLRTGDKDGAREAFARVSELREWVPIPDIPDDGEGGTP